MSSGVPTPNQIAARVAPRAAASAPQRTPAGRRLSRKAGAQIQERYAALSALEEQPTGTPTPGESAHGDDAAAIGQQLILGAVSSTKHDV